MIIVNQAKSELFLDGVIGNDWFEEGITAAGVSSALEQLGGKRVTVRINSPGGVADEGIAIYNLLSRYAGKVDTVNEALAASAASVIFLAGEKRTMATGSRFMIHRAMTIGVGNAEQLRKTADTLEKYDGSLVEIYSQFMDAPGEEIMSLLSAETWYSADEAVSAGFATEKTERRSGSKAAMAAWFKNPPQELVNAACRRDFAQMRMAVASVS